MADAKDANLGSGLAQRAKSKLEIDKAYKRHVIEAQTNGEDPLPLDEFIKKLQGDQQAENDAFRAEMKA